MKTITLWFLLCVLVTSFSLAEVGRKKGAYEALPNEAVEGAPAVLSTASSEPDWSRLTSSVGTFTTLSGFYDYQSNGGSIQHIRVNPANGNIHVVFMTSPDSTSVGLNSQRRVVYAFSSNGGTSWNNFNNTPVSPVRAGFPTIDLLRGPNAGWPVVACHPDISPTRAVLFVDSPEGAGQFVSLEPPLLGAALEPIWPYVASASDGSMIVAASQNDAASTTGIAFHNRLQNDFTTWAPWSTWPGEVQSGGRYPVQANGTGRVGMLWNTSNGTAVLGNRWRESTDNGVTWSAPVNLYSTRVAAADTFNSYVHCDFVYDGNNPLFAFTEYYVPADRNDVNIVFWSQATGFKIAVPYDSTKYFFDPVNQRFHAFNLGWPSIGMSGSTIVIVYQAFQAEVDPLNYHFSDLWYVASTNGGNTWGSPQRITNTANVDERYPSISKWNAPNQFNMVWTQKTGRSGLFAFPGGADTVRTSQVFLRVSPIITTTGVGDETPEIASSFKLNQNYPNPFNPATNIEYTVAQTALTTIKVYDVLGKEVTTLVNQVLEPGTYQVSFDGSKLSAGVYLYTMISGGRSETRKMALVK